MGTLLFGFVIPAVLTKWLAAIATPIAGVSVVAWLLKKDTKVEGMKRNAIELSRKFNENGFELLDELFDSFAVGDKSGMVRTLIQLGKSLKDGDVFDAHVKKFFNLQLTKRLSNPVTRVAIAKALAAQEAVDNSTVTVTPKP